MTEVDERQTDCCSLNTPESYFGRDHVEVFPPCGFPDVEAIIWPGVGR